jgi:hypothetical protein
LSTSHMFAVPLLSYYSKNNNGCMTYFLDAGVAPERRRQRLGPHNANFILLEPIHKDMQIQSDLPNDQKKETYKCTKHT